ncbi:DMT family transporter [Kitasatospora sp. NPDC052896]|uniref:DMT family transporter n=1 Tax=Kitasatospora sp. NPDC052896 TaxID=3364061 RepID=UPI0037C98E8A
MQQVMLPIGLALCAALSNAVATVLQRLATLSVPQSAGLRASLLLDLLHRPVWLVGMVAVIGAAIFQAAALASGEMTVVQPLFVIELPLALVIGSRVLRRRLPPRGWLAVACVVVGLGTAMAAAAPSGGATSAPLVRWIPVLIGCGGAVVLLTGAGIKRPPGRFRAGSLAAAAAICYALTAALMKSATHTLADHGVASFFLVWQTYAFAMAGAGALFLLENALQSGPLVASQPALTLGDALVSLTLGMTLYDERVRGGWWILPELLGAAMVAVGAVALARTPLARMVAQSADEGPAPRVHRPTAR